MVEIVSKPDYGVLLTPAGKASDIFQVHLDDLTLKLNQDLFGAQVQLTSYTVADLPVATTAAGMIFVSDEVGGAVPAFSDGANWLRVTDRAVVTT